MTTTVAMPSLGESVVEGEVGKWLVREGQWVSKDQPLVEILTDKADSEIPATIAGVVTRIVAAEGQMVTVGATLCEIDPAATATEAASPPAPAPSPEPALPSRPGPSRATAPEPPTSPAVRKIARDKDLDLRTVKGSGEGGRITRDDVLSAAEGSGALPAATPRETPQPARQQLPVPAVPPQRAAEVAPAAMVGAAAIGPRGAFKLPPYTPRPGDQVIAFGRRRRIIADHMVYSKLVAPHVVTFAECDLQRTVLIREAHKEEMRQAGLALMYVTFVAAATCHALREFPQLNARVLDDAYVLLRDVNLGIAVDTDEGLVVPVIPQADELSIRGLARAIEDAATRAREGTLTPDDLANKTFAVSNPGRRGNLVGGAIISQPNVGILRMGEIKKRVVVVERDGEDIMAIHPVMYLALSYDHRIVDGVHANGFLWRIVELLETGDFEV